jgi:hypothetical protein
LHLSLLDEKFGYFEERWITVGAIQSKTIVVVAHLYFTVEAEEVICVVSAREATGKVSTTVRLDEDVVLYLKKEASEKKIGYQTLLNSLLRDHMNKGA